MAVTLGRAILDAAQSWPAFGVPMCSGSKRIHRCKFPSVTESSSAMFNRPATSKQPSAYTNPFPIAPAPAKYASSKNTGLYSNGRSSPTIPTRNSAATQQGEKAEADLCRAQPVSHRGGKGHLRQSQNQRHNV